MLLLWVSLTCLLFSHQKEVVLLMAKRSNRDVLKGLRPEDTMANRDVYEEQQLERSRPGERLTMKSRTVIAAVLTFLVAIVTWLVVSAVTMFGEMFSDGYVHDLTSPGSLEYGRFVTNVSAAKFVVVLSVSGLFFLLMWAFLYRHMQVQDAANRRDDINEYPNDQHVALPEEVQRKFDWFPDVGATSDVVFSSMISHVALQNKGLKKVPFSKRAKEDIVDEDGEIVTYKGDVLVDGDGNIETSLEPLIDTDFMKDLFEASGLIDYKNLREFYDARQIPYNPDGKNRDKLGKFATVADLINADWQLPWYEPQRPGGAYLVDTAPVNTIIFCCCLLEMCYISNKVVHSEAAM